MNWFLGLDICLELVDSLLKGILLDDIVAFVINTKLSFECLHNLIWLFLWEFRQGLVDVALRSSEDLEWLTLDDELILRHFLQESFEIKPPLADELNILVTN